jgi:6-pyruvoyltetrahydropterin/6-carboxytetrahydropterin synthase
MIATIAKHFTFTAVRRLERLRAEVFHIYTVELILEGRVLANGFVIDYAELDALWAPLHKILDHKVLDDIPGLEIPSIEHVAGWIFAKVIDRPVAMTRLISVRVKESSSTWCAVHKNGLLPADLERYKISEAPQQLLEGA